MYTKCIGIARETFPIAHEFTMCNKVLRLTVFLVTRLLHRGKSHKIFYTIYKYQFQAVDYQEVIEKLYPSRRTIE